MPQSPLAKKEILQGVFTRSTSSYEHIRLITNGSPLHISFLIESRAKVIRRSGF